MTYFPHIQSIGLFGFGAFGQLIARHLALHVPMIVHDPAQHDRHPLPPNLQWGSLEDTATCPLVILAVPVHSMPALCTAIRAHLKPGSIVHDVGSVKLEPCRIMSDRLPPHVDLVGTHPLFGPQSAGGGIAGHKIALCNVRGRSHLPLAAFLRKALGLQIILTTAEQHDRELATVQGLTHLIARVLADMSPLPARMTTTSFERMMEAARMVQNDPPGVFAAIAQANPFAAEVREDFLRKARAIAGAPGQQPE
ncbi:prephenate dehydrogenase [Phycobacter sp. K97]|uniref:prephenate dehydrogenase n=1 Tax=Phycobacter sedimenti TaxID=3133977 RepID=UPI00311DF19B